MSLDTKSPSQASSLPADTTKSTVGHSGASNEVLQQAATTPAQSPEMDSKFALLAKKEKAILTKARELQAKEKMIQEMESKYGKYKDYESLDKEAKANPLKVLEKYGLTYEDLVKYVLNDNKPTPELEMKSVREELHALKQQQEQEKLSAIEAAKKQAEEANAQAVTQFKEEISEYITSNPDSAELINLYGAADVVYETIEEYFNKTSEEGNPKILSIQEAVGIVEDYLFKQTEKATKSAKKFQPKAEESKEEPKQGFKAKAPTLTNEMTSSAPSLLPAKTEQDRISRAMAALKKGTA